MCKRFVGRRVPPRHCRHQGETALPTSHTTRRGDAPDGSARDRQRGPHRRASHRRRTDGARAPVGRTGPPPGAGGRGPGGPTDEQARSDAERAAQTGTTRRADLVAQPHRPGQQVRLSDAAREPSRRRWDRPSAAGARSRGRRRRPRHHGRCRRRRAAAVSAPGGDPAGRGAAATAPRAAPATADRRHSAVSGARRRPVTGISAVSGARRRPTDANCAVSSAVRRPPVAGGPGTTDRSRTIGRLAVAARSASAAPDAAPDGCRATRHLLGARTAVRRGGRHRRGGAPGGAAWPDRSTPSPRRRRGPRGPTPGRSRRRRAASRAARRATRYRPDRPRRPGADW